MAVRNLVFVEILGKWLGTETKIDILSLKISIFHQRMRFTSGYVYIKL